MHHAPFDTGILCMDEIRLDVQDSICLYEILKNHPKIRHIFFGHYHNPIAGVWGGISFSTLRGTSHQVKLDFKTKQTLGSFDEPQYSVVLIDENQDAKEPELIVTHFHDFLHKEAVDFIL